MKNKNANILLENIVFLILNLVFLAILLAFIFTKTGSAAVLEEQYAKKIALIIDSAKPGMSVILEMENAMEKAKKNKINLEEVVTIRDNVVKVRLKDETGYEYSFFNDIEVKPVLTEEKNGFVFLFS